MIHEVSMPALSSTMEMGKIVSWLKHPGDRVEKGENILVVESDKADMDVESFYTGILASIVVPAGGSATVGAPIALIAESEAEVAQAQEKAKALSAGVATAPVPSSAPAPVAQPTSPAPATVPAAVSTPSPQNGSGSQRVLASPRAKKLAKDLRIDLSTLRGSGPNGRIVAEDVERAAALPASAPAPLSPPTPSVPTAAPAAPLGETIPLSTLQSAVVRNMNASLSVPVFHVGYTLTTDGLDGLYKQVKPKGVTMTALLAKAVAMTLEKHPLLNASYTEGGIHYKADINIAVAVAMEDGGLITPVLKQANRLDLYEISRRWKDLVERARQKQLQPDEYNSGTFTLSNLGMFGVDRFDAILPPNQGSILAIGASRPTVVATLEREMELRSAYAIAIKSQMQVNLTCDHRVIYGAHAAAFLQDLAQLLEQNVGSLTL
jgi:pyruvate dehydrogenase E2 component (dihydrolipoamide acetyltransferase)